MTELPAGTVTFLFTDIEGSTRLLQTLGPRYREFLETHRALLRDAFSSHGGVEVDTQGDAFFYAFPTPQGALQAAVRAQRALADHPWPKGAELRVRMGIHTGTPEVTEQGYVGADVHVGARICSAAWGGQVILSQSTADLIADSGPEEVNIRDLGEHSLKDISARVSLYQLVMEHLRSDFPPPRTVDAHPTNLPPALTALIGREREIAYLTTALWEEDTRLVTLTGPGGTGKTRLALEVGDKLLESFSDGVFLVDLSALTDASLVLAQVAAALGLKESEMRSLTNTLHDYLSSKQMLLVIDNFEQVMDAAPEVSSLLSVARGVRVLVTSREPLRIAGEQEVAVPPLSVPSPGSALDEAERSPAVAMFTACARNVRADFALTAQNASYVAGICRRLDGLPLALELAAARVKVLSPRGLLERLDHSLRVLSSGRRDASARQRTLRGAIEWSYELLSLDEQTLFRRLGAFAGGWSLRAAEQVCDRGDLSMDVLDGLVSLVDKSLVRAVEADEERFAMLETIREFALERLEHFGEAEEVRLAHAEFILEFAQEAEPYLVKREQSEWLDRLEMELPNARAALRWSLTNDLHMAAEIAASTGRLWYLRGLLSEGRAWLGEALEACPLDRPKARSKIAWVLAALAWVQGDLDAAKVFAHLGAATAERAKDEIGVMRCVEILALCEMEEGQYQRARRHLQDNLARSRALGDQRAGAVTMGNLGRLSMLEEEYEAATKLALDSLAVNRHIGDKEGIATSLTNVGLCAVLLGKAMEGEPYLREGIEVARDVGRRDLIATALEGYAAVLASSEDNERAALLLGAAQQVRRNSEAARDPIDDKLYETTHKLLITSMGESELTRLIATAATLSSEQVMLYVGERGSSQPAHVGAGLPPV